VSLDLEAKEFLKNTAANVLCLTDCPLARAEAVLKRRHTFLSDYQPRPIPLELRLNSATGFLGVTSAKRSVLGTKIFPT
jgi:hypothetical protein